MESKLGSHLCTYCGQTFKSTKSIEFHMNICIYYQYSTMYNAYPISNDNIKYIVNIHNILELYKLNNIIDLNNNKIQRIIVGFFFIKM